MYLGAGNKLLIPLTLVNKYDQNEGHALWNCTCWRFSEQFGGF